jgi:cytochrome P450
MNYTDMVQKEGLRMYSPVTGIFFRKTVKEHQLNNIPMPVGMTLVARNRANMFDEASFVDPFKFNPERWR